MTDVKGKVAIITGASSGIGEETARALARLGVKVVVAARRKDRLDSIVAEIEKKGGTAMAIEADVTDKTVCMKLVEQVSKEWGSIDILINNAGVMLIGPALDAPIEEWEKMVALNVMGLLYMTHATLPVMKKQGSGHIVNISSVAGRTTRSGSAVYNLTKWGVNAFTDALRQELSEEKTGVRTTLIEPGAVDTELADHIRPEVREQMMGRFANMKRLESEDIAAGIVYAVTQPAHVSVNEILIRPTEQAG
jgi:NADP-dependent 3-hydroxy acid dehydrogenase YdfG